MSGDGLGPARRAKSIGNIEEVSGLSPLERRRLRPVADRYAFRATDYYLSLIDWNDPQDPLRQILIPRQEEMSRWGSLDASDEASVTVVRGLQHKYPSTVLLLATRACAAYCRYCFRKRLFMPGSKEAEPDLAKALAYIAQRPEVREVLLTGGDPLMLSTRRLGALLDALAEVDHIQVVRISSKMVAFNPWRILDDGALGGVLGRFVSSGKSLYFMAHFDHPRELTPPAMEALERLKAWGLVCLNQCPLVKGVNDDPSVLGELWLRLAEAGCPPYYLFQLRPTAGNAPYVVPILQGIEIVESAGRGLSGLAKRARYVMSHATGKIEILGATSSHILLRYHRAPEPGLEGKIIACRRDEKALWMDDLEVVPEAECQPADSLLRRRGSFMEPERKPSRSRVT